MSDGLWHTFSLLGVTETWLKDDDCDLYDIEGYDKLKKHRQNLSGGGVAIFFKDGIEYTIRNDLITSKNIWMPKNVVIGVIHRIPNTNMVDFNATMANALEQLRMENKLVYLMGDYNIDLLNSEKHDLTNEFVDVLYCNEFLPLISRPTRITSTSATLIDNIFTNNHDDLYCSLNGILVADISDHFPIVHINCSFSVEETASCLVTRVYNERNKQKFLQAISAVDCNIPNTLNSFNHFHSMSISLRDQWFPKNEIKRKYSNRKQWLSDVLRNSVRNKNKLYHKYINIPTIRNETSYKLFRNKWNQVSKIDEKKYYREFIISHKDNTRKSWSIIKDMINKHRMPTIQS